MARRPLFYDEEQNYLNPDDENLLGQPSQSSFSTPQKGELTSPEEANSEPNTGGLIHPPPQDTPQTAQITPPIAKLGPYRAAAQRHQQDLEAVRNISNNPPTAPNPKWWQRALAGAAGGFIGYANAGGRIRPVDPSGLQQEILRPGWGQKMADYQAKQKQAQQAASLSGAQAQDMGQVASLEAKSDESAAKAEHERAQAKQAEATAKKLGTPEPTEPSMEEMQARRQKQAAANGWDPKDPEIAQWIREGKGTARKEAAEPKPSGHWTTDDKGEERYIPTPQDATGPVSFGKVGKSKTQPANQAPIPADASGENPTAKAIAEYRLPPVSARAAASPQGRALMDAVIKINPTYDGMQFGARNKLLQSFTSGTDSGNVASLNTAIGHLGTLYDSISQLDNSAFRGYNTFANWLTQQVGNPQTKPFTVTRLALSEEIARAIKGGVATQAEGEKWLHEIDTADSPERIKSTAKTIVEIFASRVYALEDKFKAGMGRPPDTPLIRPRSQQVVDRVTGGGGGGLVNMRAPNGQVKPVPANEVEHYKKLGGVVVQ